MAALAELGDAADVELLSGLGLHLSVLEREPESSPRAMLARAVALAALGRVAEASETAAKLRPRLSAGERLRLAGALAPWSAQAALDWLPDGSHAARMACLLALDDREAAAAELPKLDRDLAESHALLAMFAGSSSAPDGRIVRREINEIFSTQGWRAPFDAAAGTMPTLDTLAATATGGDVHSDPSVVSVIMPARNAAATIATAIRSVLAQRHRAIELIVVDDGSNDDTAEQARAAIAGDARGAILRQPAAGAYAARNRGLAAATGEFVTFNDADDWSHPERIGRAVAALRQSSSMALVSNLVRIDESGRVAAPRVFPLIRLNTSSLFFRRAPVLERLGGFEPVAVGADGEYLARIGVAFGADAVLRDRNVSMVVLLRDGSLAWRSPSGIDRADAVRDRMAYRESWMRRHAEFLRGRGDIRWPL